MPDVTPDVSAKLIAAFSPEDGREICRPVYHGQAGHPVLWGRRFFSAMRLVEGDQGAKALFQEFSDYVCDVPVSDPGVLRDIDTLDQLQARQSEGQDA